jgi:hypothetical protein
LASVVPGRNNTAFAVMNETKRFVPVYSGNDCSTLAEYQIEDAPFIFYGLSNATNIEWFALPDTSNAISTSFELNVTPNSTTNYRAKRYFNSAFVLSNYSVEVSSFNVNIQTTDFICNQDSIGSIVALNMNSGLLYLALSNSSGNIIENGVYTDSIIFYPPAIGNYTVIASDIFGCSQSFPVSISSAFNPLQINLVCTDTISCLGTETATIFVGVSGGSSSFAVSSIPALNINNGIAQTNIYGNYTFIASDSAGWFIPFLLPLRRSIPR